MVCAACWWGGWEEVGVCACAVWACAKEVVDDDVVVAATAAFSATDVTPAREEEEVGEEDLALALE